MTPVTRYCPISASSIAGPECTAAIRDDNADVDGARPRQMCSAIRR
jgi:hypothetical protein